MSEQTGTKKYGVTMKAGGMPVTWIYAKNETEAQQEVWNKLCRPGRMTVYRLWVKNGCNLTEEQEQNS
jgi:hypothetical protein